MNIQETPFNGLAIGTHLLVPNDIASITITYRPPAPAVTPSPPPTLQSPPPQSPIYLNPAKGIKVTIIRVLNVLFEMGFFTDKHGGKLLKKDFFTAMGRILNVDLSNYANDLSHTLSDGSALEKHLAVFDKMKQKMVELFNSK